LCKENGIKLKLKLKNQPNTSNGSNSFSTVNIAHTEPQNVWNLTAEGLFSHPTKNVRHSTKSAEAKNKFNICINRSCKK